MLVGIHRGIHGGRRPCWWACVWVHPRRSTAMLVGIHRGASTEVGGHVGGHASECIHGGRRPCWWAFIRASTEVGGHVGGHSSGCIHGGRRPCWWACAWVHPRRSAAMLVGMRLSASTEVGGHVGGHSSGHPWRSAAMLVGIHRGIHGGRRPCWWALIGVHPRRSAAMLVGMRLGASTEVGGHVGGLASMDIIIVVYKIIRLKIYSTNTFVFPKLQCNLLRFDCRPSCLSIHCIMSNCRSVSNNNCRQMNHVTNRLAPKPHTTTILTSMHSVASRRYH